MNKIIHFIFVAVNSLVPSLFHLLIFEVAIRIGPIEIDQRMNVWSGVWRHIYSSVTLNMILKNVCAMFREIPYPISLSQNLSMESATKNGDSWI